MADKTDKQRADELETTVETLTTKIKTLEADIAAGAQAAETEVTRREKERADAAEGKLREVESAFGPAVRARAVLMVEAAAHIGGAVRMDEMTDRQIQETVIKRLDASVNTSAENDDQVRGRYQTLIALATRNAESQGRVAEILGRDRQAARKDDGPSYEEIENNRWKKTLSKGRDAAAEGR